MEQERKQVTPLVIHTSNDMKLLTEHGRKHFSEDPVLDRSPGSARKKQGKRSTSKLENTASTKKSQEHLNLQYQPTMEPINEDSNASQIDEFSIFSEIIAPLNAPKQPKKRETNS